MYYGCTPRIKSKESRDLQSVLPYLFWMIISLMWKFHIRMWKFHIRMWKLHTTFNIYFFFSLTQLCCFQVEVTQSSLLSSSISLLPILCPKLSKLTLTSQSPVTRNSNYHNYTTFDHHTNGIHFNYKIFKFYTRGGEDVFSLRANLFL